MHQRDEILHRDRGDQHAERLHYLSHSNSPNRAAPNESEEKGCHLRSAGRGALVSFKDTSVEACSY